MLELQKEMGMLISEKQIMSLITIADEYIKTIMKLKEYGISNQYGDDQVKAVSYLLDKINSQQSEDLKEIE